MCRRSAFRWIASTADLRHSRFSFRLSGFGQHMQIAKHRLDLTHVTLRTGSPQTLVCVRTKQLTNAGEPSSTLTCNSSTSWNTSRPREPPDATPTRPHIEPSPKKSRRRLRSRNRRGVSSVQSSIDPTKLGHYPGLCRHQQFVFWHTIPLRTGAHFARVPLVVKQDEPPNPTDIRLFGPQRQMPPPHDIRELVQEFLFEIPCTLFIANRGRA